jgi:anti-sigma regulatory factor (Ser/Thr protein kinase)
MKLPQQPSGPARRLALDLPAAHSAVRQGRQAVRTFARFDGLEGGEVEHLVLVVAELLSNAVDHGGGGGAVEVADLVGDVRMLLDLELDDHGWTVSVRDQGNGDAAKVARRMTSSEFPALLGERGRGLYLLHSLVDQLTVEARSDGRGLLVRAQKSVGGGSARLV